MCVNAICDFACGASADRLIQLFFFQLPHSEESVFMRVVWFHHPPHTHFIYSHCLFSSVNSKTIFHTKGTQQSSSFQRCAKTLLRESLWREGGKKAHVIIIVCILSRTTVIYYGGSFYPSPFFHSLTPAPFCLPSHPPRPVLSHVNLECKRSASGSKRKRSPIFPAMLNMQITRQISGSCSQQAHN